MSAEIGVAKPETAFFNTITTLQPAALISHGDGTHPRGVVDAPHRTEPAASVSSAAVVRSRRCSGSLVLIVELPFGKISLGPRILHTPERELAKWCAGLNLDVERSKIVDLESEHAPPTCVSMGCGQVHEHAKASEAALALDVPGEIGGQGSSTRCLRSAR